MSWDEIGNDNNGSSKKEIPYVKIPVGTIKLRLVDDNLVTKWTHWIPQANGGKGLSTNCIGKGCPICAEMAKDKKAKKKSKYNSTKTHTCNVYVKSIKIGAVETPVNQIQVLSKGNKIFGQLKAFRESMGDLTAFDINITRTGEDLGSIVYTCSPTFPPSPLSDEIKNMEKFDIDELTKNLTLEQVNLLMLGKTFDEVFKTDDVTEVDGDIPFENGATAQPVDVDFTQEA